MNLSQRNYNAFKYLTKKKPKEYQGVWHEETFSAYHRYQPLIPGLQIGRLRLLFEVQLSEIQTTGSAGVDSADWEMRVRDS